MTSQSTYRVVATSPSKPDDMILLDAEGSPRLYVGSMNTVSRRALDRRVVDALMKREHWNLVPERPLVSEDELQILASRNSGDGRIVRWMREHVGFGN